MTFAHHRLAVSLALLLLTFMTMTANAQDPCEPCPGGSWSNLTALVDTLPNGCVVRIGWQELQNCPGARRYRISVVEFVSGPCDTLSLSMIQIMDEVAKLMIEHDPAGLGPQVPGICHSVTVALGSICWSRRIDPRFVYEVALPCVTTSCCTRVYMICTDSNNQRSINYSSTTAYNTCTRTTDEYGNKCHNACLED